MELDMKSLRTLATLVAVLALVGAACSSDSSDPTTTTTAERSTTTSVVATTATTAAATTTTTTAATTTTAGPASNTIVEVATAAGSFGTLLTALEAADLLDTLQGDGPFTVFAPTDDAFAKIPGDTLAGLLTDTDVIRRILLYHVLDGEVLADDVVGLDSATTLQGSDIAISVEAGTVILNNAVMVIATDILADNGVIHVVDTALSPPRR
jgi:uncharacterized surface protein with fasciclin (FAS1) repeats